MEFISHLHPVLVHLPIGILLLGCFFQLLAGIKKYATLQPAVSIALFWGMISAIASCVTGYLLAGSGDYDEELVSRHEWFGISVAVVSTGYYFLYQYAWLTKRKALLPLLLIALVMITGHLGGSLTHGSDYLSGALLGNDSHDSAIVARPIPNVQEAVLYTDIIQPMLQNKCYSCHGSHKQKGKLRMDQPDLLLKGGKDGVVLQPGNATESEMIKRILLDKSEEHHMPPKEKPQLTEKEVVLLHWWIASGASFTKKTKDIAQEDKIKPILLSLQHVSTEKKEIADVPATPVEKAPEEAIKKLQDMGVVVIPVAAGSNYLSVNFVTASSAGDKELQSLAPLKKQIVWLKLSDTKITDAGLDVVAQCSNLIRLQLDSTGVTDKGLAKLGQLKQLQSLNLVGTPITMAGLLALKGAETLKTIYVYKTGLTTADRATVKKAFPKVSIDTGGYFVPLLESDTTLVKAPKENK